MAGRSKATASTRGIRASRAKLEKALANSDLHKKTQIALAERIAQNESLSAPPKDLVNRVFRELPVDPQTLERVAKALDVEAFSLYMTSEEVGTPAPSIASPAKPFFTPTLAIIFVIGLLALAVGYTAVYRSPLKIVLPPLGTFSVVVAPTTAQLYPFASRLTDALGENYNTAILPMGDISKSLTGEDIRQKFQSDLVLHLEDLSHGRYKGINVYLSDKHQSQQVATIAMTGNALKDSESEVFDYLSSQLQNHLAINGQLNKQDQLTPDQLSAFSNARMMLENDTAFDEIDQAQLIFQGIIQQHKNFGPAFAGLCEAAIYEHDYSDKKAMLEHAQSMCDQAELYAPDHPYTRYAMGTLMIRTDRLEDAVIHNKKWRDRWPNHTELTMDIALANMLLFRKSASKEHIQQAKSLALRATEQEPDYWRTFQRYALISYASGDMNTAIKMWENVAELSPNSKVMGNLAATYGCRAEFAKARSAIARLAEIDPDGFRYRQVLAGVEYAQGNFAKVIPLMKEVHTILNNESKDHRMWGRIADAHRKLGENQQAREAYQRALNILTTDKLLAGNNASKEVFRHYYELRLNGEISEELLGFMEAQLQKVELSSLQPQALIRLSIIYTLLNKPVLAQQSRDVAIKRCKIYQYHPD